jgi:hypothetical protein
MLACQSTLNASSSTHLLVSGINSWISSFYVLLQTDLWFCLDFMVCKFENLFKNGLGP